MSHLDPPAMNNIEGANLLDSIREVLDQCGWTTGAYEEDGKVCLLGAGRKVQAGNPVLGLFLGSQLDRRTAAACGFSDASEAFAWNDDQLHVETVHEFLVNRSKFLRELG
jgi:hypothetical protein